MTTKERKQQERIAYCVEHLAIDTDQFGTFADANDEAYEIIAPTKKAAKWVYSLRCPHMVPTGKEHEECGCCLDRLFGQYDVQKCGDAGENIASISRKRKCYFQKKEGDSYHLVEYVEGDVTAYDVSSLELRNAIIEELSQELRGPYRTRS